MTYPHRMLDLYPYPWLNPIAYTAIYIYRQQYDMGLSEIGDTNMGYMGLRFTPKRETFNVNYCIRGNMMITFGTLIEIRW